MSTKSIGDLSRVQAGIRPDAAAIICEGRTISHGQLDSRSNRVANGLLEVSSEAGARIAYLGRNNEAFFEVLLGAAKAGWTLVPLNWRLAAPEIDFIIRDAAPQILVVSHEFADILAGLSTSPQILLLNEGDGGYRAWRDQQALNDPMIETAPESIAVIMYTSGTTGLPKGAQLTHANLMGHLTFIDSGAFGPWDETDMQLICLPLFHIGGTDSGLWSLYTGGTVLLLPDANVSTLIDALRAHRVTVAGFVPTIMAMLLDQSDLAQIDFSAMKLVSYGGSPISVALMERARQTFGCRFQQLFGMTETTGGIALLSDDDHGAADKALLRSCGKALPGIELQIVDPEGNVLPPDSPGEILIRGDVVMAGYWHRPEQTAAALTDGWYHSGDLGTLDRNGYLSIHDRIKDMVVTGGENVYPTEVENALMLHEAVSDVAVIGVPDPKWGEAVKALVVCAEGADGDAAALMAFSRERLAGYKCPKSIEFVDFLPRNSSGKILRRELRERYWGKGRQVG